MSTAFDNDPEFGGTIQKPSAGTGGGCSRFFGCLAALAIVLLLFLPGLFRGGGGAARRAQCINNLKQIAWSMHEYERAHGALPPAYTIDANGRRLHSWRVLLLPYLEAEELYRTIDLSKPWNDPANAKAAAKTPGAFACPEMRGKNLQGLTTYMASVAPGGCLIPGKPRRLAEITDPHDATLMVIEAGEENAVPWMAPADADESLILGISPDSRSPHSGGVHALFVDGSVKSLEASLPASTRRALISIAGKEALSTDQY